MENTMLFLPAPRQVNVLSGAYRLPERALICLDAENPFALRSAGERFQKALLAAAGYRWDLFAGSAAPADRVGLTLRIAPERSPRLQSYRLHVTPSAITVEAHDPEGVFYGVCTLVQLLEQSPNAELPCVEIVDWPDFPVRGVMLDISRDKVYSMETLYELVDRLAGWKINQVQLYTEHTFAYQNHPVVWEKASPMTGEEIMALDVYCRERFIDLVPNQNSFGHMHRWLIHPEYAGLAETHEWFDTPWNTRMKGPFSLAPEAPGSFELLQSLYDELLPHFTSRLFNVGCDETVDLGQGASRAICEERGLGRVYFDFLMRIYKEVSRRGKTMQFWGDIINNHPELVPELPRDVIALEWGYEADHPFDANCARFAASGIPFYVCPGTSTWNSLAGRTENSVGNLINAAENGLKHGALGFLNTDWGDNGHWQPPMASYLGFVVGAGVSWCLETNRDMDIPAAVSRFAFEDTSGTMGRVAYDMGNIYKVAGVYVPNSSWLFWALQLPLEEIAKRGVNLEGVERTLEAIDAAMAPMENECMARPDAGLIRREFTLLADMMRHACRRVQLANGVGDPGAVRAELASSLAGIEDEYRALWLLRNRPGGLEDSVARFNTAAEEYKK
ncbi:MAG: family 20 glycosylhydrolase [Chloroflexi bacterium]|nr:family 20 glycosylhydrolase [Chloroflexota bacterium]